MGQGHDVMQKPGFWEIVLILLAILILFGGSKLPALGKGIGEGIRNFKKGLKGDEDQKTPPGKELDKKD